MTPRDSASSTLGSSVTLVGGPTVLLDYGGMRWLTDPTFSPPGEYAGGLLKTTGPAVEPADIGPIDAILLSHDQHADNLDPAGREVLTRGACVLTTKAGAERLGSRATGLRPWQRLDLDRPGGGTITVTALPALHGPSGSESVTGPVIGFLLSGAGLEPVYVSGDNASLDVVRQIRARVGPIPTAILFAGAVQLPQRFDGAYLTLSADRAAEAASILELRTAVAAHFEGWSHFSQGARQLIAAFAGNGVGHVLMIPEPGVRTALPG